MFEELSTADRNLFEAVIQAFPEWKGCGSVNAEHGDGTVSFSIAPPSHNVSFPLRISNFCSEVVVSFDHSHSHFASFSDGTKNDALSFIKNVISDQYVAVSYWLDDQWCGSTLLDRTVAPDDKQFPRANLVRIRSWTGCFDREVHCSPS